MSNVVTWPRRLFTHWYKECTSDSWRNEAMSKIESFSEGQIESLAKVLGDCGSGSDITRILDNMKIQDESGQSTKWRRIYWIFLNSQKKYGCANQVLDFIQKFLTPTRFTGRSDQFETYRNSLNEILVFSGIEFGKNGQFRNCEKVHTLDEAEQRVQTIRQKFQGRKLHSEVHKYCRKELMEKNYFHAVFEAVKGLAQRIRELSGVQADGANLIDKVFSIERPILAFNSLSTETEKTEHKGFASLIKGCFAAIRNPLAHEPKILWDGEDDAADYLTLISLLHRKLDNCFLTRIEQVY